MGSAGLQTARTSSTSPCTLVRLAEEQPKPSAERLREYRDSSLDSLNLGLFSPAPIYAELEIEHAGQRALVAGRDARRATTRWSSLALGGRSPQARAAELRRGHEADRRRGAPGAWSRAAPRPWRPQGPADPARARARDPEARALRKRYEDEVEASSARPTPRSPAAKFAIEGENVYPDATFTLRLAFGAVKGYERGRQRVPAVHDDFGGALRAGATERGDEPPFDAARSAGSRRKPKLDLNTPYNFVCTADIIGGNSGSPVVNRAGEVVGLIFDGNLHSLVFDFAYTDEQARAVAVDSRGLLEALDEVYGAEALVAELSRSTPRR